MNDQVKVLIAKDPIAVYLLNPSDEKVSLNAGELFGFGPGSFKAMSPGWSLSALLPILVHLFLSLC